MPGRRDAAMMSESPPSEIQPARSRARSLAAVVAGLLVVLAVDAVTLHDGHGWGDDFALYILHARNLAEGRPYDATGYLYDPAAGLVGPPTYPPVTSALLAPVVARFGRDFRAMKWVMVGGLLTALAGFALLFADELSAGALLALVLLTGLNPLLLDAVNQIGSDLPFLAFLALALLLMRRLDGTRGGGRGLGWGLAVGIALSLACGTRSVGLVLLPALLAVEFWNHRRLRGSAALAVAVFVLLAVLQSRLIHSDSRYFDQWHVTAETALSNIVGYSRGLTRFWGNGYFRPAGLVLTVGVLALAAIGFARRLRRRPTAAEAFAALYPMAVILWPTFCGARLLYPLVPLWIGYALCGLYDPHVIRSAAAPRAAVGLFVLLAAISYTGKYTAQSRGPQPAGVHNPRAVALFRLVRAQTGPSDVLVFIKPRALALMTDRSASVYHIVDDDERLWRYFASIRAAYLIVVNRDAALGLAADPEPLAWLRGFVARHPRRCRAVYRNEDFTVYRIAAGREGP